MDRDNDDGAGSQRSGTTGATASETSSQKSDLKFLAKKRRDGNEEGNEEGDLLEQKRSIQDGVFACMYTLVRQSALSSWKFAVLKIVLEFLMFFIVSFNPSITFWKIDVSNPAWQVIRWTLWRSPVIRLYGYKVYITILYVQAGAILLAVVGLAWLTWVSRAAEKSKWLRTAAVYLYIVYDVIFFMCYASFFDYFVFAGNCDFTAKVKRHMYFQDIMCFEMPHLLHLCVAGFMAVVFLLVTALMVIASCDLNPVSRSYMASPTVYPRLKILFAKAVYVIALASLDSEPKLQAVLAVICVALICWWNYVSLPFYRRPVNVVWCGEWMGILYTCVLLAVLTFTKNPTEAFLEQSTRNVLIGIFPVVTGGIAVCTVHIWWTMRPANKFLNLEPGVKLSKVHVFASVYEVERLARVMRVFDIDGVVDEDGANLGEIIIKAGMQAFRNNPYLLIVYANFLLEVRKDGPAARTQLQLAAKHSPSLVEKYQVFCTDEASKRLKDSQDGGMDLQAYIEFRRNYRAVLRVHKEALTMQTEMWKLFLRPALRMAQIDEAMNTVEMATARAYQVYKKVLERYPTNGKLLRCYGKFLEDVRHDPVAAARAYSEASRNGGSDAILALDMGNVQTGTSEKPEFLASMSMNEDAVVVSNAEGTILMVSQAVQELFGYAKAELEGANVSVLMPQPFSQRHTGYMQRYTGGGEAHMLDTVKEVVAMHKERYVFPVALCVTKLNGLPANTRSLRAWISPNGVFLCGDQNFASMVGVNEGDLVGKSLASLVPEHLRPEVDSLLVRCRESDEVTLTSRSMVVHLSLLHKYADPIPVEVTISLAGTDAQRILVLNCQRTDGLDGNLMVVDPNTRIRFCACGVAAILGYPMRKLCSMRIEQLLPPPFNSMHTKWLRESSHAPTATSCRNGNVVHLLNSTGARVPVRLRVTTKTAVSTGAADAEAQHHVVEVEKVSMTEEYDEKRLVLMADFTGRVQHISRPDTELFGFPSSALLGASLCDFVDIFSEWRERNGDADIQLLLLALLDKEQEMPGASWRIRVHSPTSTGANPGQMPAVTGEAPAAGKAGALAKSACLQVELAEHEAASQQLGDSGGQVAADAALTRIRVILWRRDLLTGVLELDEGMVIRKASPLAGLIVGLPSAAMAKKPLHTFLDLPNGPEATWEKLVGAHTQHKAKKKSVLKPSGNRGVVSPPMAFIGPHPDMGTMRIVVQGVQTLGPGGKAKVTLTMHPDTAFAGARANLMRVLRMEGVDGGSVVDGAAHSATGAEAPDAALGSGHTAAAGGEDAAAAGAFHVSRPGTSRLAHAHGGADEGTAAGAVGSHAHAHTHKPVSPYAPHGGEDALATVPEDGIIEEGMEVDKDSDAGSRNGRNSDSGENAVSSDGPDAAPAAMHCASLHRQATSRSDFVAQWVRTLSHAVSGRAAAASRPVSKEASLRSKNVTATNSRIGLMLAPLPETDPHAPTAHEHDAAGSGQSDTRDRSARSVGVGGAPETGGILGSSRARDTARSSRVDPRPALGSMARARSGPLDDSPRDRLDRPERLDPLDAPDGVKPEGSEGGDSSADGSQAASAFTSITDQSSVAELAVDSRRGRLLKALNKMLLGPVLANPLDRLSTNTYLVLLAMIVTHVVCYVVVTKLVDEQHTNIYVVQNQAYAMDRSMMIQWRVMMGPYCERKNVTDKSSACANTMNFTLTKMLGHITELEQYHQGVYLGVKGLRKLKPDVYHVWTDHHVRYSVFVDSQPPKWINESAGAWQLGNRYLAAAREGLYWLPRLRDLYKWHRTCRFIVATGLGPLFEAYDESLDLLMEAAWNGIVKLRQGEYHLIVVLAVEALFIQLLCTAYQWGLVQRVEKARLLGALAMLGLPTPVVRQLASREIKVLGDDDEDDDADDASQGGEEEAAGNRGHGDKGDAPAATGKEGADKHAEADGTKAGAHAGKDAADGKGLPQLKLVSPSMRRVASPEAGRRTPTFAEAAGGDGGGGGAAKKPAGDEPVGAEGPVQKSRTKALDAPAQRPGSARAALGSGRTSSGSGKLLSQESDKLRSGKGSIRGLRINGRVLQPSYHNMLRFMAPLAVWNIAVILVYAISLSKLGNMTGPLASLNAASHVIFRYTRARVCAWGLVYEDAPDMRDYWRQMLKEEVKLLENEYEVLMYGGNMLSEMVTHNGLDVMVRRVIAEMTLLYLDDDRDAKYNNTRYDYLQAVGGRDCYEGLQTAAQLFVDYSIRQYRQILLAVTAVVFVLYVVFLVWPHRARVLGDATRQCAMLSHVPPEMDVRGHVRAVFRKVGLSRRKAAATPTTATPA
ncbi:hypothetical protein GPECTOR_50g615 [Gonium pectorale]|uniref:PAS domain-containing protein n=1 Tax=Gonium pectorale TaxID=33097 RepID=A0A150G7M3_GONPE|nr:hypothetical protein GPECTOR_50g615 [Gonium pectorale]|eukprot:KXZ45821.1 hypothetical protein GPECTOR_50g615 [Gonium pectorale]